MKHGIPTCLDPVDPNSFYMRNMFHEFFWGPFADESEVIAAIKHLDSFDEYWDYDPACIIKGANPLPEDYVFGFPFVEDPIKSRIWDTARPRNA